MGSKSSGTDSSVESKPIERSPTNTQTWSTSACLRWSQNRWTASNSMWPATTSSRTFSSSSHSFPTTNNNTFTGTLSNCCSSIHSLIGGGGKMFMLVELLVQLCCGSKNAKSVQLISFLDTHAHHALHCILFDVTNWILVIQFRTRVTKVLWKFEAVINWCGRIEAKPKHRGFPLEKRNHAEWRLTQNRLWKFSPCIIISETLGLQPQQESLIMNSVFKSLC